MNMQTKWAQEQAELTATLRGRAEGIAAALGEEWQALVSGPLNATLQGPQGEEITIVPNYRTPERAELFGLYPAATRLQKLGGADRGRPDSPRVNVTLTRDAKALARDISRRVLQDYTLTLTEWQATLQAAELRGNEAVARVQEFSTATGLKTTPARDGGPPNVDEYLPGNTGQVRYDGTGSVVLERMYLPADLAAQVINLINSTVK